MALLVLASSALLLRSYQKLHAVRPGFEADGVATLWVAAPAKRYRTDTSVVRFFTTLVERTKQLPGVYAAGIAGRLPLSNQGMNQDPFYVEGDATYATKIPPLASYVTADSGYFRAMGIPLIAGRLFDRLDGPRHDEAIISLDVAKTFFHDSTGRTALNRHFHTSPNGGPSHIIVGVVGSVRDTALAAPPSRSVYLPEAVDADTTMGQFQRAMAIVARTRGDVATTTRAMQRIIRDVDPTLPTFNVRSMRETVEASMAMLSFTMIVLMVAAAVTLVLGMIGLYGLIAYVVALRTRELGVRIALGAQPRTVATMVTKQGITLCTTGVVIGLVLVIVGGRFVRTLLFEVGPTDPVALGGAVALVSGFALLASWIPARRAARVNPAEALRTD